MSTGYATTIKRGLAATGACAALLVGLAACGDDDAGVPDFTPANLERLSFAAEDLPEMEYQHDSSGHGAFASDQQEEAEEEGDRSGIELVTKLDELGLEDDYVSQFFATSRDAEVSFVESSAFLFEDEAGAQEAVPVLTQANADNLESAEEIDPPDLGEEPFGVRGEFDGFPVYSFGWRVGDVIQIVGVAPGDPKAGPESAIELAEQLEAKGERQ
jgi:hypothetical protein